MDVSTLTHRLLARPPYASLIDKLCGQDFPVIVVVKHKNTAGDLLITVTNYISMTSVGWFWGQVWSTGNRHLLKSQCKKIISLIWLSLTFIQKVQLVNFQTFSFFQLKISLLGRFLVLIFLTTSISKTFCFAQSFDSHIVYFQSDLQLLLWQWCAGNVYLLVFI